MHKLAIGAAVAMAFVAQGSNAQDGRDPLPYLTRVVGDVKIQDTGMPAPRVSVEAIEVNTGRASHRLTDRDGRFDMGLLPVGQYRWRAEGACGSGPTLVISTDEGWARLSVPQCADGQVSIG